jgi:hypothetical protein
MRFCKILLLELSAIGHLIGSKIFLVAEQRFPTKVSQNESAKSHFCAR